MWPYADSVMESGAGDLGSVNKPAARCPLRAEELGGAADDLPEGETEAVEREASQQQEAHGEDTVE